MCENLDKARAALAEAKDADNAPKHQLLLLDIASVQAAVSQAASLERIADVLERIRPGGTF